MANRHFGSIADVWKHAVLVEVLERESPARYAETHAGSGGYALTHDGERKFGILRFLQVAPRFPLLAQSRYRAITAFYAGSDRDLYPGSAVQAMIVLGNVSSYLLCDLDPESVADLHRWSRELDVHNCEVAERDGMAAVAAWLDGESRASRLVHVDPFNAHERGPAGHSALELAARVADSGAGLVYWYGYDEPSTEPQAQAELAGLTRMPLWCGELTVTGADDSPGDPGDHGVRPATFGMILANVRVSTADACAAVGNALASAYAGATLPDGTQGNLAFTSGTSAGRP